MLEIIKNLEQFGLSTNAARAYCSLLKSNPATGYEISSQAGIPRSAVYNVLSKLESKQQSLIFGHSVPMPVVVKVRDFGTPESYKELAGFQEQSDLMKQMEKDNEDFFGTKS